jgi:GTPase
MAPSVEEWAERVFAGDRRAVARAISAVEEGQPAGRQLLKRLFRRAGNAFVIGITGSPGAGKSTLVEKLAGEYRAAGAVVGVLAVDPTSPFSGGAILGDRIRMQSLANDDGVYIRSMATRGRLGGLAAAAYDAVSVLEAAGCQIVLVETVGVGQDEVEVARLAEATVLLLVPGTGDDIQTFKAGVMEIGDIFVVNKADLAGAERVEQEVTAMLSMAARTGGWQPPVLLTVSTRGEGVKELREKLDEFREFGAQGESESRRRAQWRERLLEMLRQELLARVVTERFRDGALEDRVSEVLARRRDPYSLVEEMAAEALRGPQPAKKSP